jgi:hypothetical protein
MPVIQPKTFHTKKEIHRNTSLTSIGENFAHCLALLPAFLKGELLSSFTAGHGEPFIGCP